MAEKIKIGLALPLSALTGSGQRPLAFAEILAHARKAESLGFDSLWVSDHFFVQAPGGARSGTLDSLTLLSALAARTDRVQLGTLVLCNSFRHPAMLAKMATSLQEISGGRLILGIGAGWHEPEYTALGLPFDHRVTRLRENVTALAELLRTGQSSFQGRYVHLDGAELVPRADTPPPIWLAPVQEKMIRLTAELGDGCNTAWYGDNVDDFRRFVERLHEAEARSGRSPGSVTISAGLYMVPAASGGGLDATLKRLGEVAPPLRDRPVEQIRRNLFVGTPDECIENLRRFVAAGAEHLIISLGPRPPFTLLEHDGIERFAETVLPTFRS